MDKQMLKDRIMGKEFYPPNLKNQNLDFVKKKNDFPQNKIWGMHFKRH